ncbi:MAG TPA: sugar ABC transporter substrate-binding protein [Mycobacterium sp.]|nr:sugar ABC transporter substrate-binding protein [Mycobacterium sp.]
MSPSKRRFRRVWRPRFSTLFALGIAALVAVLLGAAVLLGHNTEPAGKTVLTVRLWDQQVAAAYRQSFDAFTAANPDIDVRIDTVSYASYFDTMRTDVAGGGAADVFWINNANFAAYADSGRLMPITPSRDWAPAVVEQFTRNQTLWGVPQLTDAGIAVYYNADLLAEAGVDPAALTDLRWGGADDTLRPLAAQLTVDAAGRRAGTSGFDPARIRQWGYNAANDFQGIYLNFVASAGGTFHDGERFTFDNPQAATAFDYLVALINTDHVAPSAADTNDNGDFSRNQFLAGRMALFQSGTYNLANVATQAKFRWGVTLLPSGPQGRISVTNGVVAAGNSASHHPEQVRRLLAWLGSTEGNAYVGAAGAAIPAVLSAQQVYREYWRQRGVDVAPFFEVIEGPHVIAPGGTGFAAGLQATKPYFDEMFLGRLPVADALQQAQRAANTAAQR